MRPGRRPVLNIKTRDVKERVPFRIFVPAFRSDLDLSVPPFRAFRSDLEFSVPPFRAFRSDLDFYILFSMF